MKFNSTIITLFLITFSIFSCVNHSESDLLEISPPEPDPVLITYDTDVKIIIDNNCIFCHSDPAVNGASFPLTTYDNAKTAIESFNLIGKISSQAGESGAMHFGGPRLPQNLIDTITQWETNGLLEE